MKVLMIAGSPFTNFMPTGVSLLAALIKQGGYGFEYFDLCNYDFGIPEENKVGESLLEFKKVSDCERVPKIKKKHKNDLIKDFKKVLENYKPDIIGMSSFSSDFIFCRTLLSEIKKEIDIPVIAGGIHPTVAPEQVINLPWIDMINIGYGEESFMELMDSYANNGEFDTSILSIWFKKDGKIIRNTLRPSLSDLDKLPYPDWSIYEDYHFYRAFTGKLYRFGPIEISRGCPFLCEFCVNSFLPDIYSKKNYVTKSVDRSIDEIVFLKERYNIEFIRFLDEIFLLKSTEFLREFAEKYQERVNIPFLISTTANSVTEEKVQLLKRMNCANVGLGVETGNEEMRTKLLNKKVSNKHYEKAYKLLNDAGIRTTAQLMFGLPHETEEDYIQTIRMIKEWDVDTAHVSIFYPFRGSKLRSYLIENNLITEKKIEEYEMNNFITTRENETLLEFSKEQIKIMDHYRKYFTVYKELPEWLWPLVKECSNGDEDFPKRLSLLLKNLVYEKRFPGKL